MADAAAPPQDSKPGLVIPEELRTKYPELITLILGSESMNDEERQYWVNILPIMTPEQIQDLKGILENEKSQLAAIDAKYQKELEKVTPKISEEDRRKRREERSQKEASHAEEDQKKAESLFEQIEGGKSE